MECIAVPAKRVFLAQEWEWCILCSPYHIGIVSHATHTRCHLHMTSTTRSLYIPYKNWRLLLRVVAAKTKSCHETQIHMMVVGIPLHMHQHGFCSWQCWWSAPVSLQRKRESHIVLPKYLNSVIRCDDITSCYLIMSDVMWHAVMSCDVMSCGMMWFGTCLVLSRMPWGQCQWLALVHNMHTLLHSHCNTGLLATVMKIWAAHVISAFYICHALQSVTHWQAVVVVETVRGSQVMNCCA